jgi:hypothetical protein
LCCPFQPSSGGILLDRKTGEALLHTNSGFKVIFNIYTQQAVDIHRYKDIRKSYIKQICRDVSFCLVFANLLLLGIPSDEKTIVIIVSMYLSLFKNCLQIFVLSLLIVSIVHSRRLTAVITGLCSRNWAILISWCFNGDWPWMWKPFFSHF